VTYFEEFGQEGRGEGETRGVRFINIIFLFCFLWVVKILKFIEVNLCDISNRL
jgi:hypothetical protein